MRNSQSENASAEVVSLRSWKFGFSYLLEILVPACSISQTSAFLRRLLRESMVIYG